MKISLEKTIKVFLCILTGVPLSIFVGQPYTITIPVTAILVVGTGLGTSWRGTRTYCLRRFVVQLVGAVLLVGPVIIAQRVLRLSNELTIFFVSVFPLSIALIIDYKFNISPLHITSMSVSGLIVIIGTVAGPYFIFVRLFLVLVGCALGVLISCIFFPRDYCKAAYGEIAKNTTSLLDHLQSLIDGVPCCCDALAMRSKIAAVQSDVAAYRGEVTRRRYRDAAISADMLALLYESQQPLLSLVTNWESRREQLSDGFSESYRLAIRPVASAHSLLLKAADGVSIQAAFELPVLPSPTCAAEIVLEAHLIEYYEAVANIRRLAGAARE